MSNQAELNSREKTLGENVVIIVLIAILMSSFLYYFFKQEQQLTTVGFDAMARKFSSSVMGIRAQWYMDGQPDEVIIKENHQSTVVLKVNKNGWVDLGNEHNCQKIWLAIMATELSFMNQPIAVLSINSATKGEGNKNTRYVGNVCRYSLPSGESFDYQLETGTVSEVTIR
ncbi:hypothetical protein AADZ91_00670 [Colwelliaceae bacterium 6441]